jgi:putative hydrolase of the HAD superfamily
MIKAIVFDFDGTLVDTETCAYEAFKAIYAEHGHELPLVQWAQVVGTAFGPFDPYEELERLTGSKLDRAALAERFEADLLGRADAAPLLPGVSDALEEAHRLGLRIGLASSSDRRWIERHLSGKRIRQYFQTVWTADDVTQVKPDPALYRNAVAALGVQPGEAVAIEDSVHGLKAAKAAGLYAIIVPNAMTAHMDFAAAGADLLIDSLAAQPLRSLLERLEAR